MPINGIKRFSLITTDRILEKVSDYDIFRYYMPNSNWQINVVTFSPFRNENNPSFMIGNKHGRLTFIDFADTSKRGSCFDFVMMLFNFRDLKQTLEIIDRDFGLGFCKTTNTQEYKRIITEYKQPVVMSKTYSRIQVITKNYTNEELAYWAQYQIDVADLKANNIYSLSKVYLNKELFPSALDELRFGYLYDDKWKIYRPYARDKKSKWVPNNVPITAMDGKDDIKQCDVALVTKSKKDYMVISKIYNHVCAVQNEGLGCFNEENVKFLKENSKKQILNFDSDVTGVINSQQITRLFNFDYINVPKEFLDIGINDFADLAKVKGLDYVKSIFEKKGLYG